jgi:hypothetical protein
MPCRRVSWIPGAEGAPREEPERCECVEEWPAAGAMRIACLEEVRWFVEGECERCEDDEARMEQSPVVRDEGGKTYHDDGVDLKECLSLLWLMK